MPDDVAGRRRLQRREAAAVVKAISLALIRRRYAMDGGAERFISRALDALQQHDVRITLITREWQPAQGVEVVPVKPFHFGRLSRNWSFDRAVKRLLRQRRFDIVQSHERIAGCDVYRAGDGVHREWLQQRARVLPGWQRVWQSLSLYHRYIMHAERELFLSAQLRAVICNSKMVRDEIQHWFGVPRDKLHVIYNGVNLAEFHPGLRRYRDETRRRHGIPLDSTLYLYVGSGFERKGVAILLQALAVLPQGHLLIVGRDKRADHYERQARQLGIGDRVIFAGAQPDVKPFYGAADVFVLPTLYDPFPNVALEAMASGLPVITSTKSGASEVIQPGQNGFVCDALDRNALVESMRSFSDHPNAEAAGRAARATAEQFGFERMSSDFVALYERLLKDSSPAA
jgi:UDP-glucose:(heptosyl)LPS alpha-1,3-glucosyltransferase